MRRSLLVLFVLGLVALAIRGRHHAATESNKAALAAAILKDVAASDGEGISWNVHGDASRSVLWQLERAEFVGGPDRASLHTDTWSLELSPSKVFGITCRVTGGEHGAPEYGFISFQPEHGDVFNALFSVGFEESSIAALERLCAKHGLRVER